MRGCTSLKFPKTSGNWASTTVPLLRFMQSTYSRLNAFMKLSAIPSDCGSFTDVCIGLIPFIGQGVRFGCLEIGAVIAQELQGNRSLVRASKAYLYRFDHQLAYRFTRQPTADPGTPAMVSRSQQPFMKRPSRGRGYRMQFFEPVRAPALIRFLDRYLAIMSAATVLAPGRLWQQHILCLHHAIHALIVHRLQAHQAAGAIYKGACTAISISQLCCDLSTYGVGNRRVSDRSSFACVRLSTQSAGRARRSITFERATPKPAQTGFACHRCPITVREQSTFSRATLIASRRISASIVFVPSTRCSCAISARGSKFTRRHCRFARLYSYQRAVALELPPFELRAGTDAVLASDQRHDNPTLVRFLDQRSLYLH
jgi:hypothetical protein